MLSYEKRNRSRKKWCTFENQGESDKIVNLIAPWNGLHSCNKWKYRQKSDCSLTVLHSRWMLEGIGKKGVGTRGWVKRFRVIVRPVAGSGATILQCGAEKRTLRQTERVTLPPHPLGGAGGSQKTAEKYHQTKPGMGLYRDGATLYKCTPTKTADLTSPPHYTQADSNSLYSLLVSLQHYDQCMLRLMTKTFNLLAALHLACQSCPFECTSVVCSEARKVGGLCFSWAPRFGFTWPRSSTPPSTHSRPTERFSAASAFQMRHSNRKRTPPPFNYSMTHSLTKAFFCGAL